MQSEEHIFLMSIFKIYNECMNAVLSALHVLVLTFLKIEVTVKVLLDQFGDMPTLQFSSTSRLVWHLYSSTMTLCQETERSVNIDCHICTLLTSMSRVGVT